MVTYSKSFQYFIPTKIIFGPNKLDCVGEEAAQFGKKVLLVTGKKSAKKYGYTQKVTGLLEKNRVETIVYDEVEENPSHTNINKGGKIAEKEKCDVVIGLGGGSALDAAKGISIVAVEKKDVWEYVEGVEVKGEGLPIIAIPTTSGTGSEVTPYSVISNKPISRKDAFASDFIYPKLAICDPNLTISLSEYYTAATGIDALAHAIEAYTSMFSNSLSDIFAIESIKIVGQNLLTAISDGENLAARSNMLLANTLAGIAIAQADTTVAHVIGEAVGAIYNTHHGVSVGVVLPAVMEYNCVTNFKKYSNIAEALGENIYGLSVREAAFKAADALKNLLKDAGLPTGLGEIGVKKKDEVLKLALREGLTASNPRSVSEDNIEEIISISM